MDRDNLIRLREQIDEAIKSETPEAYEALVAGLELEKRETGNDEATLILEAIEEAWFLGVPTHNPPPVFQAHQSKLTEVLSDMLALQKFALAISKGDLSQSLKAKGVMAGSFKAVQGSLRHLTWQTAMVARGDFSQRVDFMGEFSASFNAMVRSLKTAHEQINRYTAELLKTNEELAAEIAERNKTEEALRVNREWLHVTLTSIGDAVIATDGVGHVKFLNPVAEVLTGWNAKEAMDLPLSSVFRIVNEQTGQPLETPVKQVLRDGFTVGLDNHAELVTRDGRMVPVEDSAAPILDGAGHVIGAVLVFHDVTEKRRAEKERQRLEAWLRQAEKLEAIGTLAGGIAHDFNNILMAILGYTELTLSDLPRNSSYHDQLEQVLNSALRAKELVRQILLFSRHGETLVHKPLLLASVVREALRMLRATLPSTIGFLQNISAEYGTVMGDPTQLQQVVLNLCSNAAHAMRQKGGVLEVILDETELDAASAEAYEGLRPGRFLRLSVRDTGHGMDSATMGKIFDPYFTTKAIGEGSGLGLAVVHGIVQRHKGGISVRSEIGKGTTFDILFPKIEDREERFQVDLQVPPGGTERILFVDDEKALVEMANRMLTRLGYSVTSTHDSVEAVHLFRSDPDAIDLVITDYAMPQMTGVNLASEIHSIRPDVPIILCTGYSEMINEATANEIGIIAFVMKPLALLDFAKIIRSVLEEENQ